MALLYRAIWNDADPVGRSRDAFARWVQAKYDLDPATVPTEGSANLAEGLDVDIFVGGDEQVEVMRAALHEESNGQRWTTTLLAYTCTGTEPVLWVDVEYVTAGDYSRVPEMAAPRLVCDLIDGGDNPQVGATHLRTTHRIWMPANVGALADEMLDPQRGLPLVVFSASNRTAPAEVTKRAKYAARRLAGIATVEILTPDAIDDVRDRLGNRDLAVWGGAARAYMPGLTTDDSPFRHFLLPPTIVDSNQPQRAGKVIASRLSAIITSRRPPTSYPPVRALLNERDLAGAAQRQLIDALRDAEDARERARDFEDLFLSAAADAEELTKELAVTRQRLVVALRRDDLGQVDQFDTPDDAQSCTEAAIQAQLHLRGVVVPDDALKDLERLDNAVEARAWGSRSWQALRALDAYSADPGDAGFWQWCTNPTSAYCWPATPKKLAMKESETVLNNERLRAYRLLPVATEVDASGRVKMVSHIKVAEGGGPLAPRIYFYDDTKGATGKVHVGFFGPHDRMPNKSTN